MTITRDLLRTLRELERAATPGEWWHNDNDNQIIGGDPRASYVCMVDGSPRNRDAIADRSLIITMRNTLPALLDAAERCLRIDAEYWRKVQQYDTPPPRPCAVCGGTGAKRQGAMTLTATPPCDACGGRGWT